MSQSCGNRKAGSIPAVGLPLDVSFHLQSYWEAELDLGKAPGGSTTKLIACSIGRLRAFDHPTL